MSTDYSYNLYIQDAKLQGRGSDIDLPAILVDHLNRADPNANIKFPYSFREGTSEWINFEQAMKSFSGMHPEYIFIVYYESSQAGKYKYYFFCGEVQEEEAQEVYGEFNTWLGG